MSRDKRTIAIDFDGVLHKYNGYQKGLIQGPMPGALEAVNKMTKQGHTVVIFTTRPASIVVPWLKEHGFPALEVTNEKRPFWAIIDDRAICFGGDWQSALSQLDSFEPYWVAARACKHQPGEPRNK